MLTSKANGTQRVKYKKYTSNEKQKVETVTKTRKMRTKEKCKISNINKIMAIICLTGGIQMNSQVANS